MLVKDTQRCDVVFLLASYNRIEKTLRCLRNVADEAEECGIAFKIVLVDDASSDGTANAANDLSEHVTVLNGTGALYWAGAMRLGWDFVKANFDFDKLVVANDDISIYRGLLSSFFKEFDKLNEVHRNGCILSGVFIDSLTQRISYGGFTKAKWHPNKFNKINLLFSGSNVDAVNMNFCVISRRLLDVEGFLFASYAHRYADLDYSCQLARKFGNVYISDFILGECDINKAEPLFRREVGFRENFYSPKGYSLIDKFWFFKRNSKQPWIFYFIISFLLNIFKYIVFKIFSSKKR